MTVETLLSFERECALNFDEREAFSESAHVLIGDDRDETSACTEWLREPRRRCDDAHRELLQQPFLRKYA